MDLDIQVGRLKLMKAGHTSQRYRLEEEIRNHYPVQVAALERQTAGLRQDAAQAQKALETARESFSMVIRGRVCTDQREAGSPGTRETEAAGNQRAFTLEDIKKMQRNTASRPPHWQSDTYLRR